MIYLSYRINGVRFRRQYDNTYRQRYLVWQKVQTLTDNGIAPVLIRQR